MTEARADIIARRTTVTPEGCWVWDRLLPDGYGRAGFSGLSQIAHRAVWQVLVGPIPADSQLDHLCRNRGCVNPAHLEPVTGRENKHRSPSTVNTLNTAKIACPQGHPYDETNTYWRTNRKGEFRTCLTCKRDKDRENQRRYRARRKASDGGLRDLAG